MNPIGLSVVGPTGLPLVMRVGSGRVLKRAGGAPARRESQERRRVGDSARLARRRATGRGAAKCKVRVGFAKKALAGIWEGA